MRGKAKADTSVACPMTRNNKMRKERKVIETLIDINTTDGIKSIFSRVEDKIRLISAQNKVRSIILGL